MKIKDIKPGYLYILKMPHDSKAAASWDGIVFSLISNKNKFYLIEIHKGNPMYANKITEIGGNSLIAEKGIVTYLEQKNNIRSISYDKN